MPYFRSIVINAASLLGLALKSVAGVTTFQPTTEIIPNPERGFYAANSLVYDQLVNRAAEGIRLCFVEIRLDGWRTSPISAEKLALIRQELENVRAAGLKGIVRVSYSAALNEPDTSLDWVRLHLQQLRPLFAEFDEVIALYQAGLVGAWGEWHSSQFLTTAADRQGVFQALLDNLPSQRFIQIRTPSFVNELTGLFNSPLTFEAAFQNTPAARIAHHNDCWRASLTDMGTYPVDAVAREAQKDFVAAHTRFTPWGGETCGLAAPFTDGAGSLAEAARFHASFLNRDFEPSVIQGWQADGSFTEFQRKLGYRFVLKSASLPNSLTLGQSFPYHITLENQGWASPFNARPVFLRILAGTQALADIPIPDADPRRWLPSLGDVTLQGQAISPVDVTSAQLGFALWMPDASPKLRQRPEYSIRTANIGTWDASAGHNLLHVGQSVIPTSPNIDGTFADWVGRPVVSDPVGDQAGAVADGTLLSIASDARRVYFRIQLATAVDWFGSSRNNIYLDLDNNAATGYATHGLGSELLIQGGVGYAQQSGIFNAGTVTNLGFLVAPTGVATDIEFSISREVLFAAQPLLQDQRTISILLESQDSTWTSREFVPNNGGYAHTLPLTSTVPSDPLLIERLPLGLRLTFQGAASHLHRIRVAASPAGPWEILGHVIGSASGSFEFLDTAYERAERRFYQAERLP